MCLTIPAKIISIKENKAKVNFCGQQKIVDNGLLKSKIGDYVIIQDNIIVKKINKKEAKEILDLLNKGGRV